MHITFDRAVSKNLVPEKSLENFSGGCVIGIGKMWFRKKVSEPVSEKFGTGKSTGIGIENIWYRIKVSVSVSFKILGTVTHWLVHCCYYIYLLPGC